LLFGRIQSHFYFDRASFFSSFCESRRARWLSEEAHDKSLEKVWRKTRHLTNDGVLKILCLDVEELLDKILIHSLNKFLCLWQREV